LSRDAIDYLACFPQQEPFTWTAFDRSQGGSDSFKAICENYEQLSLLFIFGNGKRVIWTLIVKLLNF
jgi:hypothetical protein